MVGQGLWARHGIGVRPEGFGQGGDSVAPLHKRDDQAVELVVSS